MIKGVNFKFSAQNTAAPAMKGFQNGLAGIQKQTDALNRTNVSWMRGMSANRRAFQQIGFQVTDFSVQIAGGQSAMLAFIQQGGQILQFFGTWGAVLAGFLSVFGTLAYIFIRTGNSIGELRSALGVLPVEMEALRAIAEAVRDAFFDMANLLVNNFDRIVIYASVVAGFFLGKWVIAMVAAAFSVTGLVTALTALRWAMVRTGVLALVVLIGEAVYWFLRLTESAGGFGNALALLKDVAKGVWTGIIESAKAIPPALQGIWLKITASFYTMVSDIIDAWGVMLARLADALVEINPTLSNSLITKAGDAFGASFEWMMSAEQAASSAGASMAEAGSIVTSAWGDAEKALAKINDILAKTKEGSIDVRDLWAGTGDEGSGGGGPAEAAKEEVDKIKKMFDDMQSSISSAMLGSFKALLNGTKSLGETVRDILGSIVDRVIDLIMTPIFNNIAGGITSTLFKGLGQIGAFPSYEGGGHTGSGPRAGGVDGRGGQFAVLHPNETVTDHTMNRSGGGSGNGGGGGQMIVNVIAPPGSTVEQSTRQGGGGVTIRDIVIKEMTRATANGQMDRINRQRYSLSPVPVKR